MKRRRVRVGKAAEASCLLRTTPWNSADSPVFLSAEDSFFLSVFSHPEQQLFVYSDARLREKRRRLNKEDLHRRCQSVSRLSSRSIHRQVVIANECSIDGWVYRCISLTHRATVEGQQQESQ